MSERMVTREHKQELTCYGKREMIGHADRPIYKVYESYERTRLDTWEQDEQGHRVHCCSGYKCRTYAYIGEQKDGFYCPVCQEKRDKAFRKRGLDREYKASFPKVVLKIAEAARELFPDWNIRKGRDKNTIVYDASYSDREGRISELSSIARSFNCKLGNDTRVDNDTCSYNRRQIKVLDDSPFKNVVFDEA